MDGPRTSRSNTNPAGPLNWGHPSSRRPRDRKFPAERGRRYRRKLAASRTRHLSSSNREAPPRSPTRHLVLTTQQAAPQRHSPTQLGATPMPMPPQPRRPAGSPLGPRRERSSAREPAPRNSTGAAGFPLPHEPPCPAHAQSRSHPSDEAILRKRRLRDNRRESSLVSIGKQHRSCPRMQKSAGGLCQPRCLRCAVADSPSAARCRVSGARWEETSYSPEQSPGPRLALLRQTKCHSRLTPCGSSRVEVPARVRGIASRSRVAAALDHNQRP